MVIRTRLVELSCLEAVAYRQKLRGGQAGVVILRHDSAQPGLALLNHRSGEADLAAHTPADLFPPEAFQEALELTAGLPYSSRGPVRSPAAMTGAGVAGAAVEGASATAAAPSPLDEESTPEAVATVKSADYAAIVKAYTNKKGEISYELLNKTLIQAARSNPYVAEMVARKATLEEIRDHVVKANFEAVTGNRALGLPEVHRILELLDEVSPRSVLRELNDDLRKLVGEAGA